jgi:hypothetical protein
MYGLRTDQQMYKDLYYLNPCTDVHFLQGFWDSSVFRYFVGVNCLPVIVVVVSRRHLLKGVASLWFAKGVVSC